MAVEVVQRRRVRLPPTSLPTRAVHTTVVERRCVSFDRSWSDAKRGSDGCRPIFRKRSGQGFEPEEELEK